MKLKCLAIAVLAAAMPVTAYAGDLDGPARFCGYSPIIDLAADEQIEVLEGGIHGGTFRWIGPFGTMEVHGIGWASKPMGHVEKGRTIKGHMKFAQRREDGKYVVAIWNGAHGAAYFASDKPITPAQRAAIDRVDLFNEGEDPDGCDFRTIFSWE